MPLKNLSNNELIESTRLALQACREAEVIVIQHFREIEERRLWTDVGTLYQYLMKTFGLTEDQVYPRLQAMRLATELPEIEAKLQSGDLVVTNVLKAYQVLKSESKKRKVSLEEKRSLLEDLEKVSTRKADQILAEKYPASHNLAEKVKPVSPDRNLIQFYVDDATLQTIEELKAKYSHQMPEGRMEDLMKILIGLATRTPRSRAKAANQKDTSQGESGSPDLQGNGQNRGETELQHSSEQNERIFSSPGQTINHEEDVISAANLKTDTPIDKNHSRSRYISAEVRRAMEKTRHHGCAHMDAEGHRCGSTHFLQMDHIEEFHRGGSNELHNLRWLCGFHNRNRNCGHSHGHKDVSDCNSNPVQTKAQRRSGSHGFGHRPRVIKFQNYPTWMDSLWCVWSLSHYIATIG